MPLSQSDKDYIKKKQDLYNGFSMPEITELPSDKLKETPATETKSEDKTEAKKASNKVLITALMARKKK
jgi:hypothetical protein